MKYQGVESATLEFKADIPKNDQVIKTMIGFCNQNGGKLVLGVGDDGTVIGIPEEKVAVLIESLDRMIYQASSPPILARVSSQRIGEKTLVIVEVSSGMNPPYFLTAKGLEKGTYIRLGSSTLRASPDIIEELKWRARGRFYDEMPVHHASEGELDDSKVLKFLRLRKGKARPTLSKEVLSAYKVVTDDHGHTYPTVAGILLFGRDPQAFSPESFIICTHFRGISGRDVLATKDCVGTLFQQYNEAYDFVLSRLYRAFIIKGKKREERLEIPEDALREVLINGIVHRNYHIPGSTKVAIYDDRIEIFSPGNFPGPLDVNQLTLGITYIRNRTICRIFRESGYVEKLGSGFITLFERYKAYKLKKPQVIEGPNFVKCLLPREAIRQQTPPASNDKILQLLEVVQSISVGDVMSYEQISRSKAKRKLSALVDEGLVKQVGKGRTTHYVRASASGAEK